MDYIYKQLKVKTNNQIEPLFAKKLEHAREYEGENKAAGTPGAKSPKTNVMFSLSNEELHYIVNNETHFIIKNNPYYYSFIPANKFKNDMNIGSVPLTCQCLNSK